MNLELTLTICVVVLLLGDIVFAMMLEQQKKLIDNLNKRFNILHKEVSILGNKFVEENIHDQAWREFNN